MTKICYDTKNYHNVFANTWQNYHSSAGLLNCRRFLILLASALVRGN